MEKIKEELNNLIDLYNERKNIEKLTKNIEEKKKELEKLDNKVKLEIPETTKNITQKEFETAQKDFDKMQQDKKNRQDELNKKFENHKKNLLLMIDEEIYKELNNLQSSKNAYEKIANNAEKTVKRLINDFNEGKNIDQSILISARKEIEFNRKKVEQIGKKIEEYVVGATNPEQYSDLTYLKMRVKGLYLENLNENTEKDFYEKYFKEKEIIQPTDAEQIEQKNDKSTELDNDSIVDEYLKEKEKLEDFYKKLLTIMRKIIELDKSGNYNELDEKLQKANAYTEVIRKLSNKIKEIEKSGIIEKLKGKNIIRYAAIDQTEKGYIDTIMKMSNVIEEIEERATKSNDDQTVDSQNNQLEQQEPRKPENNKLTEPELTEQEKRKMVEEYLALEEKNLKAHKKLRDCLQHACEFKLQDNNKAGKMSLENARNYEKDIEKYEKQLLEMAEKVNPYLNQEDTNKLIEYGNKKNAIFREIREMKEKMLNIGTQEQSNSKPIEKDGRKIVEEYFALLEKRSETFKGLIKNMESALLYSGQNNNKIKELYELKLSRIDEKKQSILELTKQLLEMEEKVEPYLKQEEKEKIENYKIQEKENHETYKKLDQEIQEKAKTVEASKKDINNLHIYANLKDLKETKLVITYTLDKDKHCDYVNYQAITKWGIISEALQKVYPEIDFASEDGKQELKKYENADPNLVTVLSNNKNRLEEYIALLNGEKKIDVNDKNALKITYDIRKISKCELSKEEKEAIEDYAFKHRDIAEVKKNALQSIKFKFREMKEKRENKKAVKALKSGKIVTSPVKDGISSEAKDTITKMVDDKNKRAENINSMDQYILSDEEKQRMKEESDKKIKENIQKRNEERIKWQIENINKQIADAKSSEERAIYENLLKEKMDEQSKLNETTINNEKNEDQEIDNSVKTIEQDEDLTKLLEKRKLIEQKLNDLPKDDEKRKSYELMLNTIKEKISRDDLEL